MKILVINAGSTSVKVEIIDSISKKITFKSEAKGLNPSDSLTHKRALSKILEKVDKTKINAVGHRVVHGGSRFVQPQRLDRYILDELENLVDLAPIHNPANLACIRVAMVLMHNLPQVAVFDTAFHSSMPEKHYLYPLPRRFEKKYGIRRYGFHGISHEWALQQVAEKLHKRTENVNMISVHLGGGSSLCAIKNGKSYDTTMGFTPLEGVMMTTRSGSIDPSVLIHLLRRTPISVTNLENILNFESGIKAIAGTTSMDAIIERKAKKEASAVLAVDMFVSSIKKQVGAYLALLGDVQAISFTGGIGYGSAYIRKKVMENVPVDKRTQIFAIKANETEIIADKVAAIVKK